MSSELSEATDPEQNGEVEVSEEPQVITCSGGVCLPSFAARQIPVDEDA